MPKFEAPGSLVTTLEPFSAPDYSSVSLESAASEHSGGWLGGLVQISRVIHDVSSYGGSSTTVPLLTWTGTPNWKLQVLGGAMWGQITWASASPTIQLGHAVDPDAILSSWNPASGALEFRGDLNAHYDAGFLRGILVDSTMDPIQVSFNALTSGAISGAVSFVVWGYAVPDLEDATS